MTDIHLSELTKRFDDVTAVSGLDLTVRDGEFLTVVGPSGCGKSTLLRLVAGLEETTSGAVRFGDRDVTGTPASERGVAMVFQNYALYPHMDAERNMTFGWTPAEGEDAARRVADVASLLGISDLLDRKPAALSGGEKQRVAIGRALLRDPEVLLMDEPLSNLDAKLRVETRAELAELHARLGRTTLYVTHDQTEAMTLGDRVAVLADGDLQQVGPPQEVYDRPVNRFVAEFVGSPSMNVLPADVVRDDGAWHAVGDGVDVPLPAYDGALDGEARVGVRPEEFALAEDAEGGVDFDVAVTEPLGEALLLRGTVGGADVAVKTAADADVEAGRRVSLSTRTARVHVFDPETGAAVHHGETADSDADGEAESEAESAGRVDAD